MTLLTGEHDMNSIDCWCHPEVLRTCVECFDEKGNPDPGCWRCGGRGYIPVAEIDVILYRHNPNHEPWKLEHRQGWKRVAPALDLEC